MRAWMCLLAFAMAGCADAGELPLDPADEPLEPLLGFLPPVDLQCPEYVTYRDGCAGFGEPTLEVAGDGAIWYSAVCCVGQSPPIWVSRDGGLSFEALPFADRTGLVRDAFGIEGDFAIDDAGNVYFFDISAATSWITKFEADGTHVHTKADPFPPLVDRPWVRAGVEDEVFIVYNSGVDSWFYHSTDGGLTWSYPGHSFGCNLGGFGQGAVRDHLLVHACSTLWQSHDGGITWQSTPLDTNGREISSGPNPPAMGDGAGIAYVPMIREEGDGSVLAVAAVHPDGRQVSSWNITPATGITDYPWIVAGQEGHVAVAFYAADDVTRSGAGEAEWYMRIAYSKDAHTDDPTWTVIDGDPEPVHHGGLGRSLGDFLQVRHTETGDLAVAYASDADGGLTNKFVRSSGVDMGHAEFLNGPRP